MAVHKLECTQHNFITWTTSISSKNHVQLMHSWRAVQSKSSVWTCDRNVSCSCLLLSGIEIFRPLREICVPPWRCWTVERELCVHWPWRWSIEDLNCRAIESCYKRMRGWENNHPHYATLYCAANINAQNGKRTQRHCFTMKSLTSVKQIIHSPRTHFLTCGYY